MKRILVLVFLMALGSGCSTTRGDFHQGDRDNDRFEMDSADCEMKGEQRRSMDGMGGMAGISQYYSSYNNVFDACMRSKGYKRK